jgi:hypothetical protein
MILTGTVTSDPSEPPLCEDQRRSPTKEWSFGLLMTTLYLEEQQSPPIDRWAESRDVHVDVDYLPDGRFCHAAGLSWRQHIGNMNAQFVHAAAIGTADFGDLGHFSVC